MNGVKTKKRISAAPAEGKRKKPWQSMKLKYTGEAKDLIQHGAAKTSIDNADPGDALKVPNH